MGGDDLLFTQLKEKGFLFRNVKQLKKKDAYFLMYILGLMFYGMGSYLFLNELLIAKIDVFGNTNLFSILGILLIIMGISLLLFLFYQFYKRVQDKRKVHLALRNYLLITLISGVVMGLLGESIYRFTDRSYEWVKSFVWISTSYIQGITRFIFLYYCLKMIQEKSIDWKNDFLRKLLVGVFLVLSVSIAISLFLPVLGSVVRFIGDLVIAIGIVYMELFQSKKVVQGE